MSASKSNFIQLVEIMRKLRSSNGCPWDREQTNDSLKMFTIEEAYEVLDAIESGSSEELKDELGDLLLQVIFHSQIQDEKGNFDIEDVAQAIKEKLIRRHPHVFADVEVLDSNDVIKNWNAIKEDEKKSKNVSLNSSIFGDIPKSFPSLNRAQEVQKRASRLGFDWVGIDDVILKLEEELRELRIALRSHDKDSTCEEIGDLLFTCVNISRFLGYDAEDLCRKSIKKFEKRFDFLQRRMTQKKIRLTDLTNDELNREWNAAKRENL